MNTKQRKKQKTRRISSNNRNGGIQRGNRIIIIQNGEFVRPKMEASDSALCARR